ncbi:MAG: glycyl-radical enzyme activating protein [Oscillospiraceae bacterium]|nr:glycyl-radical enzyme activating protein [Oscillospiraceae bacterium]
MESALVTNIQGYSIHDGPGIRTVVFLKGCPLRCQWCANPENLEDRIKIGFLETLCHGCGRCAQACGEGAILPLPNKRIDRTRCSSCGQCVENCLYDALVSYGERRTVNEVFDKVRRDKMFYESSGGGVTVSGGEPLTHSRFVAQLFDLCHEDGINTCVETCGCVSRQALEEVSPRTDVFYFDLKIMDDEIHRRYTGQSNSLILDNARWLAGTGAAILFRQPLIPGVNNGEDNIRATAAFIRSLGRDDLALQLMPYHRMGTAKYAALDLPYEMAELAAMTGEEAAAAAKRYQELGVVCSVSR